jgi:DNA polymerase V
MNLELVRDQAKSIASTRSFGKPVTELTELEEAVTLYASRAAEKLRKNNCTASIIHVFVKTNKHKKFLPQYYNSISLKIPDGSFDTVNIVKTALQALRQIYKKGFFYKKAGVIVANLVASQSLTGSLFADKETENIDTQILTKTVLDINKHYGKPLIKLGRSEGGASLWQDRKDLLSPSYTTSWTELVTVKA